MPFKNEKKHISVIVPTYNRSLLLRHTLQSLALQDISRDSFEVIVADDGSSDDTMQVTETFKDKMNVKYVYQEDQGYRPASARNMGIKASEGRVCLFLDSGIIAARDCLGKHIEFYSRHEQLAAVIGYIHGLYENEALSEQINSLFNPEDPADLIPKLISHDYFIDTRERHYALHKNKIHHLPAAWIYFWSGHISVLKEDLLRVNMFDENFDGKWGVEDNDLGFRLCQAGVKIHLLRDALSCHYPHHTCKDGKEAEGKENCKYFHNKFKTPETEMFFHDFATPDFVDMNMLLMDMKTPAGLG